MKKSVKHFLVYALYYVYAILGLLSGFHSGKIYILFFITFNFVVINMFVFGIHICLLLLMWHQHLMYVFVLVLLNVIMRICVLMNPPHSAGLIIKQAENWSDISESIVKTWHQKIVTFICFLSFGRSLLPLFGLYINSTATVCKSWPTLWD